MSNAPFDLESMMNAQFEAAKFYMILAIGCSFVVFGSGVYVTVANRHESVLALLSAFLTALSVICIWRSERLRDIAEAILRKFEFYRALGWEISSKEIVDMLATAPRSVRKAAMSLNPHEAYFSSTKPDTPTKLLENLEESAWWTEQLAHRMTVYVATFSVIVFVAALIVLILTIQNAINQTTANIIAKVTISVIVFVFTGGYVRLTFDYNLLAREANTSRRIAVEMLKNPKTTDIEAAKALHDYQIARARSPLLPTWVWKWNRKVLNELWDKRSTP